MSLTAAERTKNLQFIATAAVSAETSTGVPAEMSTAQCILESGWLEFAPGNNPFGIKSSAAVPGRQLLDTEEWFNAAELTRFVALGDGRIANVVLKSGIPQMSGTRTRYKVKDWFAKFSTLAAAFQRHSEMLLTSPFYKKATTQFQSDRDLKAYIGAIAAKYATSPTYATQLEQLIAQNNVQTALKSARKAAGFA